MKRGNIKKIVFLGFNLATFPIMIFMHIINFFHKFSIILIMTDRIGHMAVGTEILLRREKIKKQIKEADSYFIGIAGKNIPNNQLFNMIQRKIRIIKINDKVWFFLLRTFFNEKESLLIKKGYFIKCLMNNHEYFEFDCSNPSLSFTENEENEGEMLLKQMGIKNNWFVCFHARDPSYLKKRYNGLNFSYHDFRDFDVENFLPSMEYISKNKGYAIRVGNSVEKAIPEKNQKIKDYACKYRTELGDIYLAAKCKFFVACGTGISNVSQIFNVPQCWVNVIPMQFPPFSSRDLFIYKKLYDKKKKKFLNFKEIISLGAHDFNRKDNYIENEIEVVDNTPEEILDLVEEMNKRIEGTWKENKQDLALQKKFKEILNQIPACKGVNSKIGSKFLRKNKYLIE